MKLINLFIATVTLLVSTGVNGAPTSPIGSYIIKLKPNVSQEDFRLRILEKMPQFNSATNFVKHEYQPTILNGFSGSFSQAFIATLLKDHGSSVEYVVPDGEAHTMDETQDNPPSWGLTRISEHQLDLTAPYVYPDNAGQGVDVYVVDTGIQANQTDFGNRAKFVKNFITTEADTDLNGHGTHCAGTIGSNTYGVAKYVNLYGVKVLNSAGTGNWSDVIAGISFAATDTNNSGGPKIISMSLGGGKNQAVDDAVTNASNTGVNIIVAAGNNYGQDACNLSPAGANGAFAVAASDNKDHIANFSNIGSCIKIVAPGVNIKSLWKGADGATNTISGTSMATPHVAGVAATFLSMQQYASTADLYTALQNSATQGVVQGLNATTVNSMLYNHPT